MNRFITFDVNGWLDHLVDEDGEARALGLRSCLYHREDMWLFGAQALAAARYERTDAPLIDAIDALASAAGHLQRSRNRRKALPAALWQLVADAAHMPRSPTHLALVVPDSRYLGTPKIQEDTGHTALEALYNCFLDARPAALTRNRIELVWRSVAALRAVLDRGVLGDEPGAVLVISVNRRIFWTELELRTWSRSGEGSSPLHIVRRPVMDDCEESEAWTAQRLEIGRAALADKGMCSLEEIHRWTRWVEILATGVPSESFARLGIDANAIEHRSWPTHEGGWTVWPDTSSVPWTIASLPPALEKRLQQFQDNVEVAPLAIVVENPVGIEMTLGFEALLREFAPGILVCQATGADTARAAAKLANSLGLEQDAPAWLDEVPGIELEVRERLTGKAQQVETQWIPVVPRNEAIPAGKTYHTSPDARRRVVLAPGVEHIHLHLRRGSEGQWNERYSGRTTGHTIRPSDHIRIVEPLARVRPLSGEARIEIVEHFPDGTSEALAASRASIKWSEMAESVPLALRSIPELYIFEASWEGWEDLMPLLRQVTNAGDSGISKQLRDQLYKCTNRQWRMRVFPLGSDGQPPRTEDPKQYQTARTLLHNATTALQSDLERCVRRQEKLSTRVANRMHLPLTWLFTGCPERAVEILLDSIVNPNGKAGNTLHIDNDFSAWSIYQGVGRAAQSDDAFRTIYDTLIGEWEHTGDQRQDKFLLAAVTHPMARRVSVRRVLNESKERFNRVKRFLERHLDNLCQRNHDPRPRSKRKSGFQPSLELRYVTMGYRGLCQLRYTNRDWFPEDGDEARESFIKLREASNTVGGVFERQLVERTAPYLIGEGLDPTMPGGF